MAPAAATAAQVRANYIANALRRSVDLPRQNFALGSTLQFPLPHSGVPTHVMLDFQGTLAITGTGGSLALSAKAPFNVFSNVTFIDYLGTTRVNASGYKLYQREIATRYAYDPSNPIDSQAYSNTLYAASIGGGTGAAGSYPMNFSVLVPISLHEDTTEGSLPFTLPEGQNVISITLPASLTGSNLDSPIIQTTAGFTVTLTGTVGATYYYFDGKLGVPLPVADFQIVHELRTIRDSSNLNAGATKTFSLPTQRTYYMALQDLVLNGNLDTLDITRIRFLVDGNTPEKNEPLYSYLRRIRQKSGRDFPVGMIAFQWWNKPWTPADYGSLETALDIANGATTSGYSYTEVLLESVYAASQVITG